MRKSEKEALQAMLDDEQETIKALEKAYQRAIRRIDNHIRILESDEMTQSKIYQKRYQEAMKPKSTPRWTNCTRKAIRPSKNT